MRCAQAFSGQLLKGGFAGQRGLGRFVAARDDLKAQ
jgi:hypothetical protein